MDPLENTFQKTNDAKIMIVDDEPINIDVVQVFLEDENYNNFVAVEDSTQAMRILEDEIPDLLLLDLMMPDVSGFEILSSVRAHAKFKHLPVIILTAATDTESKLKALDLGATDFLAKPLDPSELTLRVRNTLAAKAYQDQLAYYDAKTKLPNRQLLHENLERAVATANRHHDQLAVLSIEIDGFDKINDTMGHKIGDEALCIIADRIRNIIRDGDVLVRSSGGKDVGMSLFHLKSGDFMMVLNRIQGAGSPAVVAQRIMDEIRTPMLVMGNDIFTTASIGIACYPSESDKSSELLRLASRAKDYAKKQNGDSFQFSSVSINQMYEKRMKMESKLRRALEKDELVLYYQPQVNVQNGMLESVEALIRWKSDDEFISPGQFIPLAEETGLIVSIGEWVLKEACRQLKEWHQTGRTFMRMAINLSAKPSIAFMGVRIS